MANEPELTFFHAAQSRSAGVRILLEALGAPYICQKIDFKAEDQRKPDYLAVNPMGKVPAIRHGQSVVTEQVAIYIYLADYFSEAGLAPGLKDPDRGPYLRWMAFYGSCFEPAIVDQYLKRENGPQGMSPYGTFEAVIEALDAQLSKGPFVLGERFSAADILWGTALGWMLSFKIVPERPSFRALADRIAALPAASKAHALDAA
jgi:glutathione S-transferase